MIYRTCNHTEETIVVLIVIYISFKNCLNSIIKGHIEWQLLYELCFKLIMFDHLRWDFTVMINVSLTTVPILLYSNKTTILIYSLYFSKMLVKYYLSLQNKYSCLPLNNGHHASKLSLTREASLLQCQFFIAEQSK